MSQDASCPAHGSTAGTEAQYKRVFGRLLADNVRQGHGGFPPGDELTAVTRVAEIRARFPDVVISIDTWRAAVAREAIAAGADLINDTWAGADPDLAAHEPRELLQLAVQPVDLA